MSKVQVFRDSTVFADERRLLSVFSHALVQVPESIYSLLIITTVNMNFFNLERIF